MYVYMQLVHYYSKPPLIFCVDTRAHAARRGAGGVRACGGRCGRAHLRRVRAPVTVCRSVRLLRGAGDGRGPWTGHWSVAGSGVRSGVGGGREEKKEAGTSVRSHGRAHCGGRSMSCAEHAGRRAIGEWLGSARRCAARRAHAWHYFGPACCHIIRHDALMCPRS